MTKQSNSENPPIPDDPSQGPVERAVEGAVSGLERVGEGVSSAARDIVDRFSGPGAEATVEDPPPERPPAPAPVQNGHTNPSGEVAPDPTVPGLQPARLPAVGPLGQHYGPQAAVRFTPPPEPPGPIAAAAARPWLVALPIIIALLLAFLVSTFRTPVYTAETRLAVGTLNVETQQIPAIVEAMKTLSSSYARLVDAQPVVTDVAATTGLTEGEVAARISGSPVPESPIFRVLAEGADEQSAVTLANTTADSLRAYITTLNRDEAESTDLLAQYREAQTVVERLRRRLQAAQVAQRRNDNVANRRAVDNASAALRSANLRANAIDTLYRQSVGGSVAANRVQVVNPAATAGNDAGSFRSRLMFSGLVLGALIGLAVAWLVARLRFSPTDGG